MEGAATVLRRATAVLALLAVIGGARAETWRSFRAERFGTTADVPVGWTLDPPPVNGDGQGFRSPDGRARISIAGMFAGDDRRADLARLAAPATGETITHRMRGPDRLRVSGRAGDRRFVRQYLFRCVWNIASVEYPAGLGRRYRPISDRVMASFHGGPGYNNEHCP